MLKLLLLLLISNVSPCSRTPPVEVVPTPLCEQIATSNDVVLSPTGSQQNQATVTASCPTGSRMKLDDRVLALDATATITCSVPNWTEGNTQVTRITCKGECAQVTTEGGAILTPTGPQVDITEVTASCPTGKRLRLNNMNQASGATAILTCTTMNWENGGTVITTVSCDPECQEITKGTTDVILTPPGTQVDQTTVTVSCPAGKRLRIENQSQAAGATGTLTCSAGGWLDGTTVITTVSCDPECQEITKGTTDVILTPPGSQVDQTTVTVSCPAGKRLRIDNQSQAAGATGTLTCSAGGWLDGTTVITTVSCDPECAQILTGPDVTVTPPGPQLEQVPVTFSCPPIKRLKLDNMLLPVDMPTQLSCLQGMWTTGQVAVTMITCEDPCLQGWTYSVDFNACYFGGTDQLTFDQADARCRGFGPGSTLAPVRSKAESDYLANLYRLNFASMDYSDTAWIGVRKINGQFVYVDDNAPYVMWTDQWTHGTPDNTGGNEDCVQLITSDISFPPAAPRVLFDYWNDFACTLTPKQYICKMPIV